MSRTFDRYAAVVFLVLGSGFVWESRSISASAYGSRVGPNIFPMILGAIFILLSLKLLYEALKAPMDEKRSMLDYKRFFAQAGAALLYILLFEKIGYLISTFLFLLFSFQLIKRGKWIRSAIISGLFSFGVYYVFVHILQGSLPGFPDWMTS